MFFYAFWLAVPCFVGGCAGFCGLSAVEAVRQCRYGRAVFLAALGWVAARRLRGRPQNGRRTALTASVLTLGTCCTFVPFLSTIFQVRPLEYRERTSPDGKYQAILVYYDGLTFGYYFVALKPTSPWHSLGGAHEAAEAPAEGFDDIRWRDSYTLEVYYDKGACFAQQDRRWRTVSIIYHSIDGAPGKPCACD